MTKTREIYRCTVCGNVVEVVNPGAMLSCCGQPMKLMKEITTDAAKEKHVPVIEPIEGGYRVKVGSVEHPMLPEHYIQWIELLTPTDVLRHELQPGENIIAKTICTNFQNEMCIFLHFFAVRLPAWNII